LSTSGEKVNVPGRCFGVRTTSSYYKKTDGIHATASITHSILEALKPLTRI